MLRRYMGTYRGICSVMAEAGVGVDMLIPVGLLLFFFLFSSPSLSSSFFSSCFVFIYGKVVFIEM